MTIALWAWPLIGVIGAIGALARNGIIHRPGGTLMVNLSGTLVLGLLLGLGVGGNTELLIGSAGMGSYTTFSTFMHHTEQQVDGGQPGRAAAYVFVAMALGLVAAVLGWLAGRAL